jgi:LysM repeat protein
VPAGTAVKFQSAVAAIPVDKRVWWRYHKVQAGDTLVSISRTYRVPSKSIAAANNLEDETLTPETKLIIPFAAGKERDTATYARATTRYRVRKGDTVASVAENFGVSAKALRGWNRLRGNSLAGRRVLYLHLPVAPGSPGAQVASSGSHKSRSRASTATASKSGTVRHKVKAGETLTSIANSYKTTVSALMHDNRNVATLRPGMILVIRDVR